MTQNRYVEQLMEWMDSREDINRKKIKVGYAYRVERVPQKKARALKIDDTYPGKVILAQSVMEQSLALIKKIPWDDWKFCREESRNNRQVWIEVLPTKDNLKRIKDCIEDTCRKLKG